MIQGGYEDYEALMFVGGEKKNKEKKRYSVERNNNIQYKKCNKGRGA